MSGIENYNHLPGFATEFKDGGLQVRAEVIPPGTDSVLLLGTAVDGPVGQPVAVDAVTAEAIFGSSTNGLGQPNGSTLVRGFHEAYEAGCRDIRLMRITGKTAKANLTGQSVSRNVQQTQVETLGLAPGNTSTELTLEKTGIIPESIKVFADGFELPSDAFSFATSKLTLKPEMTSAFADIAVSYVYTEDEKEISHVQNGFAASGTDFIGTVKETPVLNSAIVYADGVALAAADFTVDSTTKKVTVKAGAVERGKLITINYITAKTESDQLEVKLESKFGGDVYNQIEVKIEEIKNSAGDKVIGKKVVFTKPKSKKSQVAERALEYSSLNYPTLGLLVNAIINDPNNNIVKAEVARDHENHKTSDLNKAGVFLGGANEIHPSKHELYEVLDGKRNGTELVEAGVYHLLENYTVDTIVPLGVYADDRLVGAHQNFAAQLALACAVLSHRNSTTVGVIAASSPTQSGLGDIQKHVDALLGHKNDYFMRDMAGNVLRDADGNDIDLGRFISVVAGPDVYISGKRVGTYAENSAAGYAGFVSTLRPQSAPTNKIVTYARGLRFNYSNAQLDKLTGARYVTLRLKNNGADVAIVDGPTAAQPGSDYRRLSTTRIVKEVTNELRAVCDPYIGEPNETPQRNAMSAAIHKRLEKMKEMGVIMAFDFRVIVTPEMRLIGDAEVELQIVPPMELRKITTVIGLSAGL